MSGWIGVDFDGTLATYTKWEGPTVVGEPIPLMVARVKQWIAEGKDVRIFTARVYPLGLVHTHEVIVPFDALHMIREVGLLTHNILTAYASVEAIRKWCQLHLGKVLPITCVKDFSMYQLWDDRAVQVESNTGIAFVRPTPPTDPHGEE